MPQGTRPWRPSASTRPSVWSHSPSSCAPSRPQLAGDGFAEAWAIYQDSWHMELLPDADRALLRSGDRPGDGSLRELVLSYHSDLLERPLQESVRERDEELSRLRAARTPYLSLHCCPVGRVRPKRGSASGCRRPRSWSGRSDTTSHTSPTRSVSPPCSPDSQQAGRPPLGGRYERRRGRHST